MAASALHLRAAAGRWQTVAAAPVLRVSEVAVRVAASRKLLKRLCFVFVFYGAERLETSDMFTLIAPQLSCN